MLVALMALGLDAPLDPSAPPKSCEMITRRIGVSGRCPWGLPPWQERGKLTATGWLADDPESVARRTRLAKERKPADPFCLDPDPSAPKPPRVANCDLANVSHFAQHCQLRVPFPRMRTIHEPSCEHGCRYPPAKRPIVPFGSCAVVSSSGSLLNSGCGPAIDKHDLIIRTNVPIVKGFGADVGHKTTHVLINSLVVRAMSNRSRTVGQPPRPLNMGGATVVVAASDPFSTRVLESKLKHDSHGPGMWHRFHTSSIWIPHHERWYMRYVIGWWCALHDSRDGLHFNTANPTKGIEAIAFAASMCSSIDVYGYNPNRNGQPYRYWEDLPTNLKPGTDHDISLERALLHKLGMMARLGDDLRPMCTRYAGTPAALPAEGAPDQYGMSAAEEGTVPTGAPDEGVPSDGLPGTGAPGEGAAAPR
jgi:hypothetical protein